MSDNDVERAECGCRMATRGDVFMYEPCSPTCSNYAYAIEYSRKAGKPITEFDFNRAEQNRFELPRHCPFCGDKVDAYTSGDSRKQPRPDDLALCVYCLRVGIYTESSIRKPTAEEAEEIKNAPDVQAMIGAAKEIWKDKR